MESETEPLDVDAIVKKRKPPLICAAGCVQCPLGSGEGAFSTPSYDQFREATSESSDVSGLMKSGDSVQEKVTEAFSDAWSKFNETMPAT